MTTTNATGHAGEVGERPTLDNLLAAAILGAFENRKAPTAAVVAAAQAFRAGPAAFDAADVPRAAQLVLNIGDAFGGGIYAGLTTVDGQPARLVLMPGELLGADWDKCMAWAKESGCDLPISDEQPQLYEHLKSEFKARFYWSSTQHAGGSAYAWGQNFLGGGQVYGRKSFSGAARLVRRLIIQ
ncbi:hypothetical protein [Rugamonas sp.]|uniref:hypothetical protein n=1 Tax=Rugamonas sp. TaxID=1926287 RepID=UPI0025EFA227|nr:hypothetical protein [Rugamonas sp.]